MKGNTTLPKYPKRMLRLDLNHMMQQQDVPKGNSTLGMPNIPPLEENQQSAPLFLTLPSVMMSNVMEPYMITPCETSTTKIPIDAQRKILIDITPIPKRSVPHCQINMMSQGETSNTQRSQNNNTNMMINSQGNYQLP